MQRVSLTCEAFCCFLNVHKIALVALMKRRRDESVWATCVAWEIIWWKRWMKFIFKAENDDRESSPLDAYCRIVSYNPLNEHRKVSPQKAAPSQAQKFFESLKSVCWSKKKFSFGMSKWRQESGLLKTREIFNRLFWKERVFCMFLAKALHPNLSHQLSLA